MSTQVASADPLARSQDPVLEPPHGLPTVLRLKKSLFAKNDEQAALLKERFSERGVGVINVMSSPGSGKTALLQATLRMLEGRCRAGVIVGDLATDNDARRLAETGAPVVQIETGTLCHLEADMIATATGSLDLDRLDLLVIENVGNLVCPAGYDLGEDARVVLLSVTEGEDKPLKYPKAFNRASVVLVTKIDLAEAVGFDRELAIANIRAVNPGAALLELSSRSGAGMEAWCSFLLDLCAASRSRSVS